jgi:hypothetical protein
MHGLVQRAAPWVLTAVVSAAFGAWAFGGREPAQATLAESSPEASAVQGAPDAVPSGVTPEQLRRIVNDALAAQRRESEGPGPQAAAISETQELEATASLEARTHADAIVRDARARRVWGEGERASMRALLPSMNDEDRAATIGPLFVAINRGDIAVETMGPPL